MAQETTDQVEFRERVLQYILKNELVHAGDTLVVAISGGPDSVCLLHVFCHLRATLGIKLHAAHLNHKLREKESDGDADFVIALARRLDVPVTVSECDVKNYRERFRLSLEEAAREVRYGFLAEVLKQHNATAVSTGHTRDDHVETILMHLIRGSGLRGLRGLQPQAELNIAGSQLKIVRPLLETNRSETLKYCDLLNLQPRVDTTNFSLSPMRNKIRLQLIPFMKQYNVQIDGAITRMADGLRDDYEYLEKQARALWDLIAGWENDALILNKQLFLDQPMALKRLLVRMAAEQVSGRPKDIEACHIEQMIEAAGKAAGKVITLPLGLKFITEYDRYIMQVDSENAPHSSLPDYDVTLKTPGQTVIPGWAINTISIEGNKLPSPEDNNTAYLDQAKIGRSLLLSKWRRGDSFVPLGMKEEKKLGRFMIAARIPRCSRLNIPVIRNEKQVLWLVGYRIDDRVKVTADTRKMLKITCQPREIKPQI